jgi:putative CocE/NonD family hydrolase
MSEGKFEDVRPYKPEKRSPADIDESSDAYDTISWLLDHVEHHNGRVGVLGLSYGGFYASMSAIDAHPALKAVAATAPVTTWMGGDDFFHNGAFLLPHAFNFFASFGWPRPAPKSDPDRSFDHGTPDEYKFFMDLGPLRNANTKYFHDSVAFWNTLTTHWTWSPFWAERDVLPHLRNLRPAMMYVGGWFDTENLYGALQSYEANEAQSPGAENRLVMGPWSHGQWWDGDGSKLGKVPWGSSTSRFYIDSIEVPFFDHFLRGAAAPDAPEAWLFNTGTNVWRRFDAWPPKGLAEKHLYLAAGHRVSFTPPAETENPFDEYVNDPAAPVPYSDVVGRWYSRGFMVEDQRFVAGRNDVLTYTSPVLTEDLTVAGPIQVSLVASTTGSDADWVVKLIDVFPDGPKVSELGGYQMLLRGDVLRGKFRNSLEKPEPVEPNTPTTFRFDMNDVLHTFRKGHRIMVQVQSTWFPMIDRNPGKFLDIFQAKASDYQKTRQRIYRAATHPSYLGVTVLR